MQSCHWSPFLQAPQCRIFSRQLHIYVLSINVITMQSSAVTEKTLHNCILDFFFAAVFFTIKCKSLEIKIQITVLNGLFSYNC